MKKSSSARYDSHRCRICGTDGGVDMSKVPARREKRRSAESGVLPSERWAQLGSDG